MIAAHGACIMLLVNVGVVGTHAFDLEDLDHDNIVPYFFVEFICTGSGHARKEAHEKERNCGHHVVRLLCPRLRLTHG